MKPAPFQPISYTDASSSMTVQSNPDTNKTEVFHSNGSLFWSMEEYIGRRRIFLSPDGTTLLLFGNIYFGHLLGQNENASVLEVYEQGEKKNSLTFLQFFGSTPAQLKERFDIPELGGGWLPIIQYTSIETLDWKTRTYTIKFQDEEIRTVSF